MAEGRGLGHTELIFDFIRFAKGSGNLDRFRTVKLEFSSTGVCLWITA